MRALWALTRKDVGVWLRRPSAIAATVLPPILFVLVVLIAASAVGRNPVALVMLDDGPQAARLASALETSNAFRVSRAGPSEGAAELRHLDVAAVVTIPASFDSDYAAGRPDPVTIDINNLNLDFTNDLRRSLPAAITTFYAGQPADPVRVSVRESDLRVQDVSLVQFQLVPDLVLLLTVAGVVNCGLATAREFEDQTIKELLLAPMSNTALIAGKLLAGWLTTLLVAAVVLLVGGASGLLRPAGWYWLPALGVIALFALAAAGLGAAVGAVGRRFTAVAAVGINLALYLFFLAGGISVVAFLPAWVQTVAHLTPTYYGVHALQGAIFYQSLDGFGQDVAVLVVTAVAGLVLGTLALRRGVGG
ncbi:MAG: ABC transporter permease [Candidatus Dormibacteraeota bacterium]|nr:ABC transporter permease [Candidatus Dormibacteraeota bacterium]